MSDSSIAFLPDPSRTFPEVFAAYARDVPDAVVFTEVVARGRALEDVPHTFASIDARTDGAERALRTLEVGYGDRVVLCIERPDRFFVWFLAAERIGAVPVPLPCLGQLDAPVAFRERVQAVCADSTPRVIVLDDAESETLAREAFSREAVVISAEDPAASDTTRTPDVLFAHVPKMSDMAFLQYTSGSTGRPKGVVVTHGNLVANFRAIAGGAGFGPEERSLSWLPLYHDMGLIGGFLLGIYMHTAVFTMRPRCFLYRPDSWLRAMTRHRATFTVAPNFAYSLVGRKLPESALRDVDLSSLRLAFNGAEPIDRATVETFVTRLSKHGLRPTAMYPVYGLAECTLAVAFPVPGSLPSYDHIDRDALEARSVGVATDDEAHALTVMSVGHSVPDHRVHIVALDSDRPLADREIGEIVFTGPSVSPGYFGQPQSDSGSVRTGDLGYLVNGALHVVDRIKDLVILRGRNYAPSDLERTIARVSGLTRGSIVTFSVPGDDGTERLVVVAALDPTSMRSVAQMTLDVKHALAESFTITNAEVRVVAPGSIPKTSSGKVMRRACRAQYLDGTLREVDGVVMRAGFVADRMRTRIGAMLTERE